jgi:hypothetical protein
MNNPTVLSDDVIERVADALAVEIDGQAADGTKAMWKQAARVALHAALAAASEVNSRQRVGFTVLWARSDRYKRPQLIAAWSDGYVDAYGDAWREERDEKMRWFRDFGDPSDGPWSFWISAEAIDAPACEHDFQRHPESEDYGICSLCGAEDLAGVVSEGDPNAS